MSSETSNTDGTEIVKFLNEKHDWREYKKQMNILLWIYPINGLKPFWYEERKEEREEGQHSNIWSCADISLPKGTWKYVWMFLVFLMHGVKEEVLPVSE